MKRRFKGVREFAQRTTGWDVRSQLRFMSESGRDIHSIISPDWCPIGPSEPIIPQRELTPWLPSRTEIYSWDRDFWMMKPISSVHYGKRILREIYDTLIRRDEREFYKDYVPIRWYYRDSLIQDFDETLDKFKVNEQSTVVARNFAISEESVRPMILTRAAKMGIEVESPKANRTILWARKSLLMNCEIGKTILNYWRHMEERSLKFGVPSYPLHIGLVFEDL